MNYPELIEIGRLGKREPDGYYHIHYSQSNRNILKQITECYLIFNSNRVFFVTVKDKQYKSKSIFLKFLEDGIDEEYSKPGQSVLALDQEELDTLISSDERGYIGYLVFYNGENIGVIDSILVNPLQSVISIGLNDDRELLVPDVSYYVETIDHQNNVIILQNLEQLLEICTSV